MCADYALRFLRQWLQEHIEVAHEENCVFRPRIPGHSIDESLGFERLLKPILDLRLDETDRVNHVGALHLGTE